jgi:two-component system sensor histidine kinase and response regulator WspE
VTDLGGFSMHELFRAEVETHCAALSEGLLGLEHAPDDVSVITPLMRAAHSVKGAARIVGIDAAVSVAHHMEDVLVRMQKGQERATRRRIDQLLEGTDFLLAISKVAEADIPEWSAGRSGEINAITTALAAPLEAAGAEPAAPEAASAGAAAPAAASPAGGAAAVGAVGPVPAPPPPTPPVPEPAAAETVAGEPPAAPLAPAAARRVDAVVQRPVPAADTVAAPGASAATAGAEPRAVRVNADNLDRMMRLAGESMVEGRRSPALRQSLNAVRAELARARETLEGALRRGDAARIAAARDSVARAEAALGDRLFELENFFRRTEEVSTALYHEVIGSRMRPFREGVAGFPRMVRDVARQLGKDVRLEVVGGDVPVDRDILARLEAPLNHIVRNAVDHGIESPEDRRARGKPPQATVTLEARHHAGQLLVRVTDDGRGIDPDAVRRKVVERGMQSPDVAARLGDRELFDFLFLPGFSTAKQVTEISGRGVGLDVVHQMVTSTSGTVRVESRPGSGTAFVMQLPVTLSVVRAALVQVADEPYAFPLARIDRVVRVGAEAIASVQGRLQCDVDGRSTGLVDGAALLGLGETARGDSTSVVVLGDDHGTVGVVVERFLGEQDLVVRTLDPRLGKVPHVAAAAILDDGSPALILDVEDTLATLRKRLGEGTMSGMGAAGAAQEQARSTKRILVAEDSITVREVERQLLLRMGYDVAVAVDGMDAWNQLRDGRFDMLVTDIDMPRMNGIELVRTVRADARFAHLPIAVVSYKDREEDRRAGLDAGANAYLTKGSFRDQSFAATVTELLGPP